MENRNNIWIKPILTNLNTNLTLDPGLTCAQQNKLGGPNIDALSASNAPCSS
jgi:hypothetical protein